MSLRTALLVCGMCAVAVFAITSPAEYRKPAAPTTPEFGGKVLVLTLSDNGGGVFESADLKTIGDRTFIVATAIDMGNQDWRAGARVWMAVSEIHQLVEFNNVEDARKAYQAAFQNMTPRQRPARKPTDGL